MLNGNWTVFGLKKGQPAWAEELLCDTDDKNEYLKCLETAKKEGTKVTRVYKPSTFLSAPDFASAVRI